MIINRRQVLSGLASSAVGSVVPNRTFAASSCNVQLETRSRIIDSSKNLAKVAKQIANAGASTAIRFYSRLKNLDHHGPYQNEVLTKDELIALEDQGLAIATVFQYFSGGPSGFHNKNKKIFDVAEALNFAERMKQPEGSTIYFGADFRLTASDVTVVKEYFEYAQQQVTKQGWKIGVYGCGKTCEILEEEKWQMDYWLSASVSYWHTAEFFNSNNWTLFQTKTELHRPYGVVDTNILNPKFTSFGQWRTNGKPSDEPAVLTQRILDDRAFVATKSLQLFSDPARPEKSLVKLEGINRSYALRSRPVRILCREDNFVGVSFDESDALLGYCRASDLSTTITPF